MLYIRNVKQRFLLYIERWNLHVSAVLLRFIWCVAVFSEIHFSTVRTSGHRKTDCIRVNCDVYDKTSRIEEGVILSSFQELWTCRNRFYHVFLCTFFCHEFINVYSFYNLYFDGMIIMKMMMMSWRWILMHFPQNIPNISLFPSMTMDLADLATRDPFRSIDFRCIYSFTRSMSLCL